MMVLNLFDNEYLLVFYMESIIKNAKPSATQEFQRVLQIKKFWICVEIIILSLISVSSKWDCELIEKCWNGGIYIGKSHCSLTIVSLSLMRKWDFMRLSYKIYIWDLKQNVLGLTTWILAYSKLFWLPARIHVQGLRMNETWFMDHS